MKRCFLPSTIFKASKFGQFVQADALTLEDKVVDREGQLVNVLWACQHPCRQEHFVELITATAQLTVTACHRILTQSVLGEQEVLAKDVKFGSWVIVGRRPEQITGVNQYKKETAIVEVGFENDALVEAWPLPVDGGLVTRGQVAQHISRSIQHCKDELEEDSSIGPMDAAHLAMISESRGRRNRRSRRRFDTAKQAPWRQRTPSPE